MIPPNAHLWPVTRACGHYDLDGAWQDEAPEEFAVLASIQPATDLVADLIETGARTSATWMVITASGEPALYTTDVSGQHQPDTIDYNGRTLALLAKRDLGDDGVVYLAVERGADLATL
jgi:hypothetical protein